MTERIFFRRILSKPDFFTIFAKYLDGMFPDGWVYNEEDVYCEVEGTLGWDEALKATCVELNIYDAYEYWFALEWDESDDLDAYLGELLCACVYDDNGNRINT